MRKLVPIVDDVRPLAEQYADDLERLGRFRARVAAGVADDGPGIPAELRARVFEPFFTTRREGTGLGLAIARRLVTDVGGRIGLDSEEGRGTRVHVILPAAVAADGSHRKVARGRP